MKRTFIRGILPPDGRALPAPQACVAAIGVFDGVHRGHQKVILRAVSEARRLGLRSCVVTFDPHPASVLYPRRFIPCILTLEHRLRLIEQLGVDECIIVKFSRRFASASPGKFVDDFLVKGLNVRKVVIGRDFHFGHARKGSVALLTAMGCARGFSVEQIKIIKNININIKSTRIKELVSAGDLVTLKRFLSRRYSFLGTVEPGDGRGRKLGYPTANLAKENVVILPSGIYLVTARWCKKTFNGLCYIGRRSTFKGPHARIIQELHLFGFHGNLYGQQILVEFVKKLRDDKHFFDEKDLLAQIARDVLEARSYFARR